MKFTLRDLFLVTVIVALVVGWWVDHRRQEAAKAAVESDAAEMANHLYWVGDYLRNDFIEKLKEKYKPLLKR
jgi:hypothetical protein